MIWEIIIVLLGVIVLIAGYVIPARKDENEEMETFSRDQVQEMVSEEVEAAKGQLTEIVDETITYAMEKTERSMDRISNEKMMAVSEYSDTVLDQINKSHEEVVFLYDMLTDKHENLKETVAEATKAATEVKESIKEASAIPVQPVSVVQPETIEPEDTVVQVQTPSKPKNKPVPVIKTEPVKVKYEEPEDIDDDEAYLEDEWDDFDDDDDMDDGPEITFNARTPGSRNSNERILELHKAGKSNMAIAKELGLGVGEVKLVIDLFKGL